MKKKTGVYLVIGMIGIALALSVRFLLQDYLSASQSGAMIGIGAGLFGFGISKWCFGRWSEKNPELMKQNEIEANDERNQFIRLKAQALCGEIFHWILMAGAWICIVIDAPLWVTLLLVGTFLLKTILDLVLMAYYQRRM
ncbi:hypothetical protein CE91St36_17780 [Christensenellaceae bacterium]|nr:hypothetical protein CE91St36_17780 [Christensenellaceae bacterium]BDF61629.1 hypothetical protein CE91St37_17790 [Christensenellaceae bacterium]